ncbi:AsnC family transcriptional regulator [Candidatus Woesearchaeota archaeon]|nr:AsnC family transcriptional regulator [Candidatus Woesearchaeota archaeon]
MVDIGRISEEEDVKVVKLDMKDKRILAMLSENSRNSLTTIAHRVGLSRDSVDYRIKRFRRNSILLRTFPIVDLKRFGFYTFHVFMLINEMKKEKLENLLNDLKNNEHVRSIIEYTDRWDLEVVLVAKSMKEFDNAITEIVTKYPELIIEKDKLGVIRGYHSAYLPGHFCRMEKKQKVDIKRKKMPLKLDKKDVKIIAMLSQDSRASTYEIAKKVNLSADAVGIRIKKMYNANIIRKFTTLVSLTRLHYHWFTFALSVRLLDKDTEKRFRYFVNNHPYIVRAVKTLGSWDLLVYIAADHARNFHKTVKEIKNSFATILETYQTWIAYKEHYFEPFPRIIEKEFNESSQSL